VSLEHGFIRPDRPTDSRRRHPSTLGCSRHGGVSGVYGGGVAPDPLLTPVAVEVLKTIARAAVERVLRGDTATKEQVDHISRGLQRHLTFAESWSSRVQIGGMSGPAGVIDATVELRLDDLPRRFRHHGSAGKLVHESGLRDGANTVVLGDPGAGKTTTLKRLTRRALLGAFGQAETVAAYPIVVLCRSERWEALSVVQVVARAFGIDLENLPSWAHRSLPPRIS
jgi:hypothetical protein